MRDEIETEDAQVIPLKIRSDYRLGLPVYLCRDFGLNPNDIVFLKPDKEHNVLIIYLQGHYKLTRAKVEKIS